MSFIYEKQSVSCNCFSNHLQQQQSSGLKPSRLAQQTTKRSQVLRTTKSVQSKINAQYANGIKTSLRRQKTKAFFQANDGVQQLQQKNQYSSQQQSISFRPSKVYEDLNWNGRRVPAQIFRGQGIPNQINCFQLKQYPIKRFQQVPIRTLQQLHNINIKSQTVLTAKANQNYPSNKNQKDKKFNFEQPGQIQSIMQNNCRRAQSRVQQFKTSQFRAPEFRDSQLKNEDFTISNFKSSSFKGSDYRGSAVSSISNMKKSKNSNKCSLKQVQKRERMTIGSRNQPFRMVLKQIQSVVDDNEAHDDDVSQVIGRGWEKEQDMSFGDFHDRLKTQTHQTMASNIRNSSVIYSNFGGTQGQR